MVKFFSLSSGSNGNCYYIGNGNGGFLIDAGIGPRTVKKRLMEHGIDIDDISFVLVSHDHIDHIKGLGILAEKYSKPVYATAVLHASLDNHPCTRCRLKGSVRKTVAGEASVYEDIKFTPFIVPHDATETVGYHIEIEDKRFTFLTDLGEVTDEVQGNGHLSNEQTASAIKRFYHKGLKHIFLCHLSENNNTPDVAMACITKALRSINVTAGKDVKLSCLPRRSTSELYTF